MILYSLVGISMLIFFVFWLFTEYKHTHFVPIAIETSGVMGPEALAFIRELGHRLKAPTTLHPLSAAENLSCDAAWKRSCSVGHFCS